MSNTKFTPGPWAQVTIGEDRVVLGRPTWPCTWHGDKGRWEVARLDDMISDENPEEADANHRLISAAPELYEALRKLADFADKYVNTVDVVPLLQAADAAMDKACGE